LSTIFAFRVAGVTLGDIHLRFAWQAWHLETATLVSRGRRGTYGTGLGLVSRLGALGRFAWQALQLATSTFVLRGWHLAPSTFVSRGRRDTYGTGLALAARLGALGRQ